tara:strand:- start:97 stop:531 length:435 start_codon:yes stop_codon:yes gene_type:complete
MWNSAYVVLGSIGNIENSIYLKSYLVTVESMPSIQSSIILFKALSEITRLKIIWLLINMDSKTCVSEIVDVLNVPQYNVSRHLRILSKAGLLEESKEGKWVYYYIKETDSEFLSYLKKAISILPEKEMAIEIERCQQKLLARKS